MIRRIQTTDETLNRIQDATRDALVPLERLPWASGYTEITAAIDTTDTPVYHGLGHAPKGWLVTKRNALATVAELTASGSKGYVLLRASAPVTCTLIFW